LFSWFLGYTRKRVNIEKVRDWRGGVSVGLGVSEITPPWGATRGVRRSAMVSGHRAGVWGRYFGGIVICLLAIPRRVRGSQRVQQAWAKCLIFRGFGLLRR
jgi:hypothetical protein